MLVVCLGKAERRTIFSELTDADLRMARTDLAWIGWGNLIKFGLAGVSVAVFSYYILQARVEQQNPTLWQRIKAVIRRNGDPEGKPSLEDENEKTGWIEYLKDSFLSPESQEVIEDIGRLIGQEH